MGEAKQRHLNGGGLHRVPPSGLPPGTLPRIRVVPNIKIETLPAQGVVMMMLGDERPELGAALDPDKARELARALVAGADRIKPESRIIIPD